MIKVRNFMCYCFRKAGKVKTLIIEDFLRLNFKRRFIDFTFGSCLGVVSQSSFTQWQIRDWLQIFHTMLLDHFILEKLTNILNSAIRLKLLGIRFLLTGILNGML